MHYAFAMPILPGKADLARQFTKDLLGPRKAEYDKLQRRMNVEEERYFLQQSPEGDIVIVAGIGSWANLGDFLEPDTNPFDRWMVDSFQEIAGFNLLELPATEPELMGEWKP